MTTLDTEQIDALATEGHSDTLAHEQVSRVVQATVRNAQPRCMVYMAGPITKPCPLLNAKRAMLLWDRLRLKGFVPMCPHLSVLQQMCGPTLTHAEWLDHDFEVILRCDVVMRMPGESAGADMETDFAKHHGIPVVGLGAVDDDAAVLALEAFHRRWKDTMERLRRG